MLIEQWQNVIDASTKYYNKHHKPKQYNMGEIMVLAIKNLKQKWPSKKLSHYFIRLFKMDKIVGKQVYCLILPPNYRIHLIFHILLLELYIGRKDELSISIKSPPELIDNNKEWEIEKILEKKKSKNIIYYLIKWVGYNEKHNKWVIKEDLEGAKKM